MRRSHRVGAASSLSASLSTRRPRRTRGLTQALPPQPYPPAFEGQTRAPAPPHRSAYEVETLATGLVQPWALAFMPDGRMLVTDRGLLDTTLLLWHGEFGRLPISQRGVGRDHNPGTMTVWMAGAGIDGGQVIGASDEFGYKALEQPISAHDLHGTILHLLGMDHTKLTYRFNGRDMRLTDVEGTLIPQITSA